MSTAPNYLGSLWNPVAPANRLGGMNIVSGEATVAALIVGLCLTKQGEDPYNPSYGLSLDLFGRIEDVDPDYWASQVAEAIWKWVPGVVGVRVDVSADSFNGKLAASITYQSKNAFGQNLLVFPYHLYTGAIYYEDKQTFLNGISLNGDTFGGII
jgi:phage baseplate assembly protein W